MGALPKTKMSVAEFLEWSRELPGDQRYELVDGVVVAMAPERLAHGRAKLAATNALSAAIAKAGLDCEAVIDSVGVSINSHSYRMPDGSIHCGALDSQAYLLNDPVVLVEVVSPSSEERDVHAKLTEYFQLSSLHHYLIVYSDRRLAVHHQRTSDGVATRFVSDGAIVLDPPGITIAVTDLFGEVDR